MFSLILPFRVDRTSSWVAHRIRNENILSDQLPPGMSISKCRIFEDQRTPQPFIFVNTFSVNTPMFIGARSEIVTLAEGDDKIPRFVVLDCLSNTFGWHPKDGVLPSNAIVSITDNLPSSLIVDVKHESDKTNAFSLIGTSGKYRALTHEFAVRANEHCYYRKTARGIRLFFDPDRVGERVVQLQNVRTHFSYNKWQRFMGPMMYAFYHPHTMDFLCVIPGSFFLSMLSRPK